MTLHRGELVGAQVVAPRGAELAQELALLIAKRLPLRALSDTHIYPSYAYALHQTADRAAMAARRESKAAGLTLRLLRRAALGV